mmetsp:Transcript_13902/g.19026  ORF Transcript_13902/g.19026 Transcript_13902/m.19026 type:complete len:83 (+) Transcript_13902:233-481(+)
MGEENIYHRGQTRIGLEHLSHTMHIIVSIACFNHCKWFDTTNILIWVNIEPFLHYSNPPPKVSVNEDEFGLSEECCDFIDED